MCGYCVFHVNSMFVFSVLPAERWRLWYTGAHRFPERHNRATHLQRQNNGGEVFELLLLGGQRHASGARGANDTSGVSQLIIFRFVNDVNSILSYPSWRCCLKSSPRVITGILKYE